MGHFKVDPFFCVICEREITTFWRHDGPGKTHLPPICLTCESGHGVLAKSSGYSERSGVPHVAGGRWMDRRIAKRIGALAEAIKLEALSMEWRARNGA